ncbi:ARM repeat-containing protein [Punctularia strigosozonata HHB-11173 SS5]|uniref:ARM repeat-containing protein n=1 Tax=Punctularia strigosozonata (strain HHB-11173) TaxID=741275 RepID=UPI000441695E|nr:ARM repeat-containing protein [Punctularia strigosozonata HHB-11173 SS5]EIN14314.1 ARM repeat-containing protein [Punctularia strigosozonata HHB-11173 SS5]
MASQHPFDPFKASTPSNNLGASMWAPKQQTARSELDESWATGFPRSHDEAIGFPQRVEGLGFHPLIASGNDRLSDVFGGADAMNTGVSSPIGAIGDGRSRPRQGFPDAHVEQLFRTLNLNSPPPPQPAALSLDCGLSPDVSPMSQTSALLTPVDLSPARTPPNIKTGFAHDFGPSVLTGHPLFGDSESPRLYDMPPSSPHNNFHRQSHVVDVFSGSPRSDHIAFYDTTADRISPSLKRQPFPSSTPPVPQAFNPPSRRVDLPWYSQSSIASEWLDPSTPDAPGVAQMTGRDAHSGRASFEMLYQSDTRAAIPIAASNNDPINFLSLLHPSSSPPYHLFVTRIIKSSDQQASIFLQQKLKVANLEERHKIVDAICTRGYEMMAHRFGNWAVQRCLEAATTADERRKIASCMRGRVVELATNCYGCHVLQKALDCEEDIRFLIVSELLLGDPAQTLVNKHASHVWSKIMELTWSSPAPPIFAYVHKSLQGQWAALACHETGSLVVQHAFENLEESAKSSIVDELLNKGPVVFAQVAKNQWGSYCIQHILEHGSPKHRTMTIEHLLAGLLEYATHEQGAKSVNKALKEGGKDALDRIVQRMADPAKGARRAMIVDLALSVTGSQLIANVLPNVDKEQRNILYESIRGHIVTLRGCKTGSKVIWLFDRMRAYYGY